MKVDVSW